MLWFDAHLDLACLAVNGRDMLAPPERAGGPWRPCAVTLPSLREGGVRAALATVFTEPDGRDAESYPAGDVERASLRGRAQLEVYCSWQEAGHALIDLPRLLRRDPMVGRVSAGMGVSEAAPHSLEQRLARAPRRAPLHLGILIENADPVRSPDELPWWKERGVMAVGLAWGKPSRYAMGNATPPEERTGLTGLGREMVRAIDALSLVHDVSHLSDRAMDELFSLTDRPVMASHSNCRALLTGDLGPGGRNQRLLRDESIAEIGRRGGVVGLNLFHRFITESDGGAGRATVADAARHIEHVCGVMGRRDGVCLGSDMDGGLSAEELPVGITRPAHLPLLAGALRERGWREEEVRGFACENLASFLERASSFRGAPRSG